jgi:hypothetical protein
MGLSLSTDFILGMLLGGVGMLLVQQLTRTTSSLGKFMPLLLLIVAHRLWRFDVQLVARLRP